MSECELTIADKEAIRQIRRWPTLYHSARDFFHNCVVGSQGGYKWVKGKLVCSENSTCKYIKGKHVQVRYPYRVSQAIAEDMRNRGFDRMPTVYPCGPAPINALPDDLHKDWASFITFQLYLDTKLPPELYEVLLDAHDIIHYGMKRNPNGSTSHYAYEWNKYFQRIPFYQAALRMIEEKQRIGMTPPAVYQGIDI